jgi:hypothetical protein
MDVGTGILLNIEVNKLATAQYAKQISTPQCGVFLTGTFVIINKDHA